jgi:hypothetical protein
MAKQPRCVKMDCRAALRRLAENMTDNDSVEAPFAKPWV